MIARRCSGESNRVRLVWCFQRPIREGLIPYANPCLLDVSVWYAVAL